MGVYYIVFEIEWNVVWIFYEFFRFSSRFMLFPTLKTIGVKINSGGGGGGC